MFYGFSSIVADDRAHHFSFQQAIFFRSKLLKIKFLGNLKNRSNNCYPLVILDELFTSTFYGSIQHGRGRLFKVVLQYNVKLRKALPEQIN